MATAMKTISYSLYENYLNSNSDDKNYIAKVNAKGHVEEEQLTEMITERNSTVTKQEVNAVLDLLSEVVKSSIEMGYNVNTRIFKTSLSIRGTFDSMTDEFDDERHNLMINVKPAITFRNKVGQSLSIEKTGTRLPVPVLFSLYDYASDTSNFMVTPGNTVSLNGENLQVNGEVAEEGIFLTTEANPHGFKADRIISCTAKSLIFMVPADLAADTYKVEIRCGFGKTIRSAELAEQISVS